VPAADGPDGAKVAEVGPEDGPVKEHQGVEGLVLGAGTDAAVDGQVGEEPLDVGGGQLAGVPPRAVALGEPQVVGDPGDVTPLGGQGVMADAEDLADLIEQLHGRPPGGDMPRRGPIAG
jgi:hypothetical protein